MFMFTDDLYICITVSFCNLCISLSVICMRSFVCMGIGLMIRPNYITRLFLCITDKCDLKAALYTASTLKHSKYTVSSI